MAEESPGTNSGGEKVLQKAAHTLKHEQVGSNYSFILFSANPIILTSR